MSAYVAPTAQFYPSASLRVTDVTLYNQIRSDYNLGQGGSTPAASNILIGVSPVALAAQYGINWVNNPVTSDYNNLPGVFTQSTLSKVNGVSITPDGTQNGVQTLSSSYTDPNGQTFSTVTWAWQVEVQLFTVINGGKFQQQIVTWTGDGTSNRLIPTTFDLTQGVTAVWGVGGIDKAGGFNSEANFFRHNQSSMTGTALFFSTNPVSTAETGAGTDGITAFTSGGFRVSAGSFVVNYANTLNVKYAALVVNDTSFDNRYLQVGSYLGINGASIQANVVHSSAAITYFGGPVWTSLPASVSVTDGSGTYTMTWSDATHATLSPAYNGSSGIATFSVATPTRTVAGMTANSHIWVFGGVTTYKSPAMGGTLSVGLISGASGAAPSTTLGILSVSANAFVGGANCNVLNRKHTFMAITPDATLANLFLSGTGSSTAAQQVVTGLPFSPGLVFGRQGSAVYTDGAHWKHSSQATLAATSFRCLITGANVNDDTQGIVAIGASSLTLGVNITGSVAADPFWYWGWAGSGSTGQIAEPGPATWGTTTPVTMPDGTTSQIETMLVQQGDPGSPYTLLGSGVSPQWWCNPTFGYSAFQIDSPGAGWVACSGPATLNGWYLSTAAFGAADIIVSGGNPADPRPWSKLSTWTAIGNMAVFGGSPSAACNINNRMVYPGTGYVVGTDYPPIRLFDGRSDKELCRLPPTTANVIPKAVMSMLAANGTTYLTTWDSGTTSADWNGRVFQLDPETGVLTVLGTKFANGEMPYALCWHMGRLWCGTNNSIGTVGKVYFFRPGIDTAWTLDHSTASDSAGGVTSMASYLGKLYVGTDNAAASRGKVLVRDTAGAYTTSQTGAGGTAKVNNGYLALTVLGANLYASYWNNDTTVISRIEKLSAGSWSTAYTGVGTTLVPYIQLQVDNGELYALGGSVPYDAALVVTSDGTTWTDLTPELPAETATLLPMFGAVVT